MKALRCLMPRVWARRGPLACALLPLALLYFCLTRLRTFAYAIGLKKTTRLPRPVVVVGNVTVGGSGKTPLVIYLCQQLQQAGFKPGVISRGYGARITSPRAVRADSSPDEVGDEPLLIARRTACPVFVCPKRVLAGRALLASHPEVDVLISDDGLQHLALGRDANIIVMDERGGGNGWLLPAGPLRERRGRDHPTDTWVFHGEANTRPAAAHQMHLCGEIFYNLRHPHQTCRAADFTGPIHAVAGIGHPSRFFATLRALGLDIIEHPFPDHHHFTVADVSFEGTVLMTEKDAVKCAAFERTNLWALRVEAIIEPDLLPGILELLNGRKTA